MGGLESENESESECVLGNNIFYKGQRHLKK